MKNGLNIYYADADLDPAKFNQSLAQVEPGKWVRARPIGYFYGIFQRLKFAYWVYSGKVDILKWYKQ